MDFIRQTIVFDAADIDEESSFWAAVLEGKAVGDEEWKSVRAPEGRFSIGVQLAPQHKPSTWPEEPARTHLDLWVDDIASAHEEIIGLGATLVKPAQDDENFNVYFSPAGHPFCLCWPTE